MNPLATYDSVYKIYVGVAVFRIHVGMVACLQLTFSPKSHPN